MTKSNQTCTKHSPKNIQQFPSKLDLEFRNPYRKDLLGKSGGLLAYINSNIPSEVLKIPDCPSDIQKMPVELNLLKKHIWLVIAIYTPPS